MNRDFCDICEVEVPKNGSGSEFKYIVPGNSIIKKQAVLKVVFLCDSCGNEMRKALDNLIIKKSQEKISKKFAL